MRVQPTTQLLTDISFGFPLWRQLSFDPFWISDNSTKFQETERSRIKDILYFGIITT